MLKNVHGLLPYNHNNFVVQVDGAFQFHKFDEKSYEKNNCHHRGIVWFVIVLVLKHECRIRVARTHDATNLLWIRNVRTKRRKRLLKSWKRRKKRRKKRRTRRQRPHVGGAHYCWKLWLHWWWCRICYLRFLRRFLAGRRRKSDNWNQNHRPCLVPFLLHRLLSRCAWLLQCFAWNHPATVQFFVVDI